METATEDQIQIVVRQVPKDLWRRFKVQAAAEGITLQVAVQQAIKQYIGRAA